MGTDAHTTKGHDRPGIAGRIAGAFLDSKLTPLFVFASLVLGLLAVAATPREEEPQIIVPMMDVFVAYPGATAREVEDRVTTPMEKKLWEIDGVEYVYSTSMPGMSMAVVRFYVGEDVERSLVRLYNKLMSNRDMIPPGAGEPLVKPRSIDDVPILALSFWSATADRTTLRAVAVEAAHEIQNIREVSETTIIGGEPRRIQVDLDPAGLKARGLTVAQVLGSLRSSNVIMPSGSFSDGVRRVVVRTGSTLRTAGDVASVVIGVSEGRPVYLGDVARISDGPGEPRSYVFFGLGPAYDSPGEGQASSSDITPAEDYPAVTLTVAKKKGTNASTVAEEILRRVDALKGRVIPDDIRVSVTRNYGATAKDKSDELLEHMLIATVSVIILIALALGRRESLVVAVAVPVTLALTLFVTYLYGYTLNRVTLFALIFSIGILVDDAIVVVENIHRRFILDGVSAQSAVRAVDEVGNPTILATFAVIAALLPMAAVSGLMGPYMRPIPVGASAAMLFSLAVAFVVTPWLGYRVLRNVSRGGQGTNEAAGFARLYRVLLTPLLDRALYRWIALGAVGLLLAGSMILLPIRAVTVKMLPFDNKSELQIIIDTPEGTPLEDTTRAARAVGEYLKTVNEVANIQIYAGTAGPYNFNGLVRHYFLRQEPHTADIQVNFVDKSRRAAQGHSIAKRIRPRVEAIAGRYGARVKIAEIPPGPPVLSTLVAEVYGPDHERQVEIADGIRKIFEETPGVVDVDWLVEEPVDRVTFAVDRTKAASSGVSVRDAAETLGAALNGALAGLVRVESEREPMELVVGLGEGDRSGRERLASVTVASRQGGGPVALSEIVEVRRDVEERAIYHKNLKRVVYVLGDVAGTEESPVYAISTMKKKIAKMRLPEGYALRQFSSVEPPTTDTYAMKWDGEWHITYEVFRDLGIAFGAVLIIIYILVVAWFRSFTTPLVIMAPIPLTLVGILPGHWLFGAFFTATSMIGFIALSGIIVRNSILLVDFIRHERERTGNLKEALIGAGAVRFRPIALTAAAVVVGSFVMLFDPIFQGLAIAMMFGAVVSTLLTLVAVPLLYYVFYK